MWDIDFNCLRDVFVYDPQAPMIFSSGIFLWLFAAFILIYLVFLLIMGIPVMVCEFGVGRASRHSVAAAYETLEPKGTKWHITKLDAIF